MYTKNVLCLLGLLLTELKVAGQSFVIDRPEAVQHGIGIGSAIAIAISWSRNESVLFAILHRILGWLYVIYYLVIRKEKEKRLSQK